MKHYLFLLLISVALASEKCWFRDQSGTPFDFSCVDSTFTLTTSSGQSFAAGLCSPILTANCYESAFPNNCVSVRYLNQTGPLCECLAVAESPVNAVRRYPGGIQINFFYSRNNNTNITVPFPLHHRTVLTFPCNPTAVIGSSSNIPVLTSASYQESTANDFAFTTFNFSATSFGCVPSVVIQSHYWRDFLTGWPTENWESVPAITAEGCGFVIEKLDPASVPQLNCSAALSAVASLPFSFSLPSSPSGPSTSPSIYALRHVDTAMYLRMDAQALPHYDADGYGFVSFDLDQLHSRTLHVFDYFAIGNTTDYQNQPGAIVFLNCFWRSYLRLGKWPYGPNCQGSIEGMRGVEDDEQMFHIIPLNIADAPGKVAIQGILNEDYIRASISGDLDSTTSIDEGAAWKLDEYDPNALLPSVNCSLALSIAAASASASSMSSFSWPFPSRVYAIRHVDTNLHLRMDAAQQPHHTVEGYGAVYFDFDEAETKLMDPGDFFVISNTSDGTYTFLSCSWLSYMRLEAEGPPNCQGDVQSFETFTMLPFRMPFPVDCTLSQWSAWGDCTHDSAFACSHSRSRTILTPSVAGGLSCPKGAELSQTEPCSCSAVVGAEDPITLMAIMGLVGCLAALCVCCFFCTLCPSLFPCKNCCPPIRSFLYQPIAQHDFTVPSSQSLPQQKQSRDESGSESPSAKLAVPRGSLNQAGYGSL